MCFVMHLIKQAMITQPGSNTSCTPNNPDLPNAANTHVLLLVALHLLEPEELLTLQLIQLTLVEQRQ
jgi:hypothetical protein